MGVQAPTYKVAVVRPPPPYTAIGTRVVGDTGHFAGTASDGTRVDFVFWSPETGVLVLAPPAGTILGLGAMDNFDNVAVNTTAGPYLWSASGGWRPVERYAELATSVITAMNDGGQMVGYGFDGDGDRLDTSRRTLAWRGDGHVRLVKPETTSIASAINEHRAVLATAFAFKAGFLQYEAVLSPHTGEFIPLGDLDGPDNGIQSIAVGLSENGFAAVDSTDPDLFRATACYWSAEGGLRSLALGPSHALGMSRRGTMVGIVPETVQHPFYSFAWNALWGTIDLAGHLAEDAPQFDLLFASGISGNGTIAASGFEGSVQSAVILAPKVAEGA